MTTKEAFEMFLSDPDLVAKTSLTPTHKRALRFKLKNGGVTHDAMHKWLLAAGFRENLDWKTPKGWKAPESKNPTEAGSL